MKEKETFFLFFWTVFLVFLFPHYNVRIAFLAELMSAINSRILSYVGN